MLGDVLTIAEKTAKTGGRSKGDVGYVKHYGVFTEVTNAEKYKGADTWRSTQDHFGDASAQDMANALIELSKSSTSTSIKVGKRVLVSFTEADFAELAKIIKK